MESAEISDNHRRAMASAMHHVENMLREFVQLIDESARDGSPQLPAEKRQELLARIAAARQHVDDMRTRFKIPARRPRDPSWAIQVGVAHLWEMLEDCKSEPMRGYGEVPEATKPILDAEVQRLIDVLQNLAAAARGDK